MSTRAATRPSRFHVDSWDPSYGSSVESSETVASSSARVSLDVEHDPLLWAPVSPRPMPEPAAILFVDGVRRVDARIWIEQPPPGPIAGAVPSPAATSASVGGTLGASDPVDAVMGLCASYAAGVVCCCRSHGAHLLTSEARRGLFTTATNATDIVTSAGPYRVNITADDAEENLAVILSSALQRQLAELEVIVAAGARSKLSTHLAARASGTPGAAGTDLLVIDGPLRGRTHLPRALGFIKSHRAAYLPPDLHAMVARLAAAERTPVFLMGTSWDRHSWYLRLPCRPGAPWTGVVRVECAANVSSAEAVELANLSQAVLPRYASVEYKDTRAPQNLVPVAGLERQLRRRLGAPALLARALRQAAAR
jgi:hypothetical protein